MCTHTYAGRCIIRIDGRCARIELNGRSVNDLKVTRGVLRHSNLTLRAILYTVERPRITIAHWTRPAAGRPRDIL